jgi:phosphotransferase system enzyme I (PtsI)
MEIRKGIPVSPGVVISTAVVLDAEDLVIPRRTIDPARVDSEVARFHAALELSLQQVQALRQNMMQRYNPEIGAILDFHVGMLRDRTMAEPVVELIRSQKLTAESAVSTILRRYASNFAAMTDRYLAERVNDIFDIERRILHNLIGQATQRLSQLTEDVVVIAHDLLPSQTVALDRTHVRGFATDVGGRTSHTAIVARALGIPAVVGVPHISSDVTAGDTIIIDGDRGVVIINPDPETIEEHRGLERRREAVEIRLRELAGVPATTLDGHTVSLQANIEFPAEVSDALARGADGIGLYRTEFLYLASEKEPTEEEQYQACAQTVQLLGGRPLVIRTLDLGADKYTQTRSLSPERNPFLGDRSIRMCLHDIPMFKRQLRAILRASVLGDVRIMFPMISTIMELRQARLVLKDVMDELEDEGIPFRRDLPVGMMVEVPSAALMASQFAREVNFFSIGTNDLIQYTLAVDRTNEKVASLYCPAHPAVLMLIRDVLRAAQRAAISVSICGEMAGEPQYALLLLGMGLTNFSMNSPDIAEVKKIIRSTTLKHAREVARRVMGYESERQILHYLREETRKIDSDY